MILTLLLCTLVVMPCLVDEYFRRGQLLAWPGSVSSTSIMQLVSEEAGERGCGAPKPRRLGSRWSFVTKLQIHPGVPWEGKSFNSSDETLQLIKLPVIESNCLFVSVKTRKSANRLIVLNGLLYLKGFRSRITKGSRRKRDKMAILN